ncbi:MAG: branched-chain amino acid ABC transporter permease [Bosea sp.]|uniref:branched-chain amino acid ABC transporter permease n=1 Tax=Bosea sp. (in: a-proteobacteria) TaxID=1871050 RepID=UPI001AC0A161|nr:branched-chain amino acid ABC transporter permease [Bosea sp. (in: a-proteobacteria)]MBN9472214.1 branched-chain amino acid ABC transporter permease [Bosea sp. (in: a-proteobacteria)]
MTRQTAPISALSRPTITFGLLLGMFVVLPAVLQALGISFSLGTEILIIALFAMSYNILLGTTGLASFGHAAFFGSGAYAVGIAQNYGIDGAATGLAVAFAAGLCAALLVGLLVMKKRGIYFGLLTLAFGQMFYIVALRWDGLTGGETGLTGLRRPAPFGLNLNDQLTFYYFILAIFMVALWVIWRITHSPFGSLLAAIKSNELRTQYLGYDTARYKLAAMAISGALSGLAGGLYAWFQYAAYPQNLFWIESGNIVILTLLGGGLSSFFGPILGAAVFVGAQDLISSYTEHWMFFFGLIFILVVTAFPNGLPEALARFASVLRRSSGSASEPASSAHVAPARGTAP